MLTIASAAYSLKRLPYYSVSWPDAFLAGLAGLLLRLPDIVLSGAILFGLSAFIFRRHAAEWRPGRLGTLRLVLEPMVMFGAVCFGIALWYPGVLSHPMFLLLDFLSAAWLLTLVAAFTIAGAVLIGRPGRRLRLVSLLLGVGLLSPVPLWIRGAIEPAFGAPPTAVLLGIDSISAIDDLSPIANWTRADGGTWYERAVTPGLFTNAVWTSILTEQPIRTHRVFHTFLRMRAQDAVLLQDARKQGYRTIAMFSDQLTAAPGPTAGFDDNRSGLFGWRQLILPMVSNSSIIAPVIASALPRPWPGASLSNEAGSFTYNLRREVRGILRAGDKGQRTFVSAHLTYVHLPVYPSTPELTLDEFIAVLKAPASSMYDRTMDWQDLDRVDDPVPLNHWKIRRVQTVIQEEVQASGYLKTGGRLVVFSDHGNRNSLNYETFLEERYHHVLLATFGVPASCPAEPISLIDVGRLLGFSQVHAEPLLEFAYPEPGQWPAMFLTSKLRWSGHVDLDENLSAQVLATMRNHKPYPNAPACPK